MQGGFYLHRHCTNEEKILTNTHKYSALLAVGEELWFEGLIRAWREVETEGEDCWWGWGGVTPGDDGLVSTNGSMMALGRQDSES